jgi:hypothetical protein
MGDTDTVNAYSLMSENQGRKRLCEAFDLAAAARPASLFCRLAWDRQDWRSATLRWAA